ncbi:unnamed protein product [Callosobruchus maculatus]|uniref:Uncharacterized protein n=1 Tax=Callosobruchus maculatus TaxID=64391 RepID=A0A653C1Q9_CALMS|nr:unnamed protein product [Callosobruchus maculatus]
MRIIQRTGMSSKTLRTIGTSRPIRMWIDGKCFDVKQHKHKDNPLKRTHSAISDKNDESGNAETLEDNSSSQTLSLAEILKDENGKISTSFELPPYVFL